MTIREALLTISTTNVSTMNVDLSGLFAFYMCLFGRCVVFQNSFV